MVFSRKPEHKVMLLLDVQSSVVRSTLLLSRDKKVPLVIYSVGQNIPYQAHTGTSRLIKSMLRVVRESIDQSATFLHNYSRIHAHTDASIPKKISSVHYILSSPWIVSKADTISKKLNKPAPVTRNTILSVITEHKTKNDPSRSSGEILPVEEKVFDVKLNGYSLSDWEGKTASELGISYVVSVAGKNIIEKLSEAAHHLVHNKIEFHSALLLEYIGLQLSHPHHHNYIRIHAHGELTDVVIVEHGMPVFFGSFAKGLNTICRSLAHGLHITQSAAESMLSLHNLSQLDKKQGKTETLIKNMSEGWTGEMNKLFKSSGFKRSLPKVAVISSHSHEDFFKDSYKRAYHHAMIEGLEYQLLKPIVEFEQTIPTLPVAGLYAIALYNIDQGQSKR